MGETRCEISKGRQTKNSDVVPVSRQALVFQFMETMVNIKKGLKGILEDPKKLID